MFITANNASEEFKRKTESTQDLINQALYILHAFGVPLDGLSSRRLERIAMAFLAVADVKSTQEWALLKDSHSKRSLRTRDIIIYINQHFNEHISSGSYDDIRRKDLIFLVASGIVINTIPDSARNNSQRGYAISAEYADIIRTYQPNNWQEPKRFLEKRVTLADQLNAARDIAKTTVKLPTGQVLSFSPGEHNLLQKAIIEEFLPRYGYNAEVLYVGDTTKKFLLLEAERLRSLHFFELSHGELPDIIAYSEERNWLYLIEAVHSSGPISPMRLSTLKNLTASCTAEIVYITAFLNKDTFRRFINNIAWETEV
jgi:type II restriction enzyme